MLGAWNEPGAFFVITIVGSIWFSESIKMLWPDGTGKFELFTNAEEVVKHVSTQSRVDSAV
jgi:hypothetical protein